MRYFDQLIALGDEGGMRARVEIHVVEDVPYEGDRDVVSNQSEQEYVACYITQSTAVIIQY